VLLTGGTGTLGAALAADILTHHPQVRLVCLVRPSGALSAEERLMQCLKLALGVSAISPAQKQRVEVTDGQLSEEMFGLREEEYAVLVGGVDCIVHCAACVNHVQSYEWHRAANITGTRRVIELACGGASLLPIHLISTASVPGSDSIRDISSGGGSAAVAGLSGYVASKWCSEVLCQEAAKHGCGVNIFRPSVCFSHSLHGFCKQTDLYPTLLAVMLTERVYPVIDQDATFDMTPVDYVARGINHIIFSGSTVTAGVTLVAEEEKESQEGAICCHCYHAMSPKHEVSFRVLVEGVRLYLRELVPDPESCSGKQQEEEEAAADLTPLPFVEFRRRMSAGPLAPLLQELREGGRPAARHRDTASWRRALDTGRRGCSEDGVAPPAPSLPDPEVTPQVVRRCLQFLAARQQAGV
jgi:thioester reductase-like protein